MDINSILIVEDNLITAFHLEKLLLKNKFSVIDKLGAAENVENVVSQKTPDLVLMDVMLLGSMSGIDAAIRIRKFSEVPIIFITALSDFETEQRINEISHTATVQKPFDEKELLAKIQQISS